MTILTSVDTSPSRQKVQTRSSTSGFIGMWLVFAATMFNVGLCFVNARHWVQVGSTQIAAISLVILLIALMMVWRDASLTMVKASLATLLIVITLKLFNNDIDLKVIFDVAVPLIFYLLGRRCSVSNAERMLIWIMSIVVAIGLIELFLPTLFQNILDIRGYYTNKGIIGSDAVNYGDSNFFTSAQRSEEAGRTLLPSILGQHRVSSVFLEPVSMGNFPIICLAWLLSVNLPWTMARLWLAVGSLLCIILPDSRQASVTCLLMLLVRWSPMRAAQSFAISLPIITLAGLTIWGWIHLEPSGAIEISADSFAGRLMFSGKLLASWTAVEWLGLQSSMIYTADTGYAYLANNLSVVLLIIVWGIAMPVRSHGFSASGMRNQVALYASTSLCIGGSMLSIKTAALLWFLYGADSAHLPARGYF